MPAPVRLDLYGIRCQKSTQYKRETPPHRAAEMNGESIPLIVREAPLPIREVLLSMCTFMDMEMTKKLDLTKFCGHSA